MLFELAGAAVFARSPPLFFPSFSFPEGVAQTRGRMMAQKARVARDSWSQETLATLEEFYGIRKKRSARNLPYLPVDPLRSSLPFFSALFSLDRLFVRSSGSDSGALISKITNNDSGGVRTHALADHDLNVAP